MTESKRILTMTGLRIEAKTEDTWSDIVKGVDVRLDRGEVLGLIGESGAGKSTIGLAAMGYARPGCRISGGELLFDGIDLRAASEEQLRDLHGRRIAYVAQSAAASFNPAHRLIEQFTEGPVQHGISKYAEAEKDGKKLFKTLDLPEPDLIGYRYPHQVSGGQLQRAMTAMAMACKPDLIIFDEPTTALDVTTQIEVLAAIKDIVKRFNTAAIYVTHDLAVVAQMADRIMVLRHGLLVEENTSRELIDRPKEAYTKDLLSVRTFRKPVAPVDYSAKPILEVSQVNAYYGSFHVLNNVSLKIQRATTMAVVGESGSGKSTLARVITGLLPATSGTVEFDGEQLASSYQTRSVEHLRRMQMIYQMPDTALNPRQKIGEIIGRPLTFYHGVNGSERDKKVAELLDMIELPANHVTRRPSELSGGQKQRICIARALAANPDLIICDEITSALDELVSEEILKLLQRLQDDLGVSYLFITHDLATVKAISDEIVVMLKGQIVEQGRKEEVLSPPHHEYTELLLSSVPEMDPDWLDRVLNNRRNQF
jgi:peptide/nickel transport system ATP-binding protein